MEEGIWETRPGPQLATSQLGSGVKGLTLLELLLLTRSPGPWDERSPRASRPSPRLWLAMVLPLRSQRLPL